MIPPDRRPPTPPPLEEEQQGSIFAALTPLVRNWRSIIGTSLLLGIVAAGASLLVPEKYTAVTTFTTESARGNGSSLGDLASQLSGGLLSGVSIGSLTSGPNAEVFAEVLTSRELLEETLNSRVREDESTGPDSLRTVISMLDVTGDTPPERMAKAVAYLGKHVTAKVDPKSQIVTLTVQLGNPRLAADVANRMVELLNAFNIQRRQFQSKEERVFVEGQLDDAGRELHDAEARQLSFLQANRTYTASPVLSFEEARLQRDVDLKQEVFLTLTRAYDQARVAEVRDTPVLTIIDEAVPPIRKSAPRRRLIVMVATLVGVFVSAWLVYYREFRDQARAIGRPDYQEFERATAQLWADLARPFRALRRSPPRP